ncbi:MAG: HDIG domain-containing protein [Candidatus Aenigmarchaeota archaeon]|nr:HDIG domain-containing protein [Candidatus Aenigmarchaeota archaeon]
MSMKELFELAGKIKDKNLREKTTELLKKPAVSNPEITYPAARFDEIPAWAVGSHHSYTGGELDHTVSIVRIALGLAEHFEKTYGIKVNKDHLISGALLHDIMKCFIIKKEAKGWGFTGTNLDHGFFSAAELYARGFPEEVIHIVAAHGGDQGSSAANPRTIEGMLVYYADVIDSAVESHVHGTPNPLQVLLMKAKEEAKDE